MLLSWCHKSFCHILHWHYFINDFVVVFFSFSLSWFTPFHVNKFHTLPSFNLLLPVCPFCKYSIPLLPVDIVPMLLLTSHSASVFLSPALLPLQSFLTVKVLLPHSHLACPSLHSQCGPRAAPSPPRMPTSRTADSWPQPQALGAQSSTATLWIWAALMAPQVALPEEAITPPRALDVPDSTVTRQRA